LPIFLLLASEAFDFRVRLNKIVSGTHSNPTFAFYILLGVLLNRLQVNTFEETVFGHLVLNAFVLGTLTQSACLAAIDNFYLLLLSLQKRKFVVPEV